MIQTFHLTKRFGNFIAIDDLNIHIKKGEIYGFLGPNGAGKTTTIKMLLGLLRPTSGIIKILGEEFTLNKLHIKKKIGVVPEKHPLDLGSHINALDYLSLFTDMYMVSQKKERISYLLKKVDLYTVRNKRIREYSRGMLQKLSIVRALLHEPEIIFLDEPISGLDPIGIKQVRDLILGENKRGKTVFISSHLLSEVEKICQRFAIIHKGKLRAEGSLQDLNLRMRKNTSITIEVDEPSPNFIHELEKISWVEKAILSGNVYRVLTNTIEDKRKDLAQQFIKSGLTPFSINTERASLEDAFITFTNENISMFMGDINESKD